jgi:hypothetical protein
MGWDQKKFSWRELGLTTAEVSGETTNDSELPERRCFARVIKIPLADFEQAIADQQFAFRFDQSRLHVFEIDALNRLLNVQVPLRAGRWIGAVPIERAVSGIAVLLDFDQQIACAYPMNTASREKNGIARLNGDPVNVIDHGALEQSLLKPVVRDWFPKSNEQLGARIRGDHVPKLALWFASESAGNISRRMNLQRQLLLRIENFDKQRKTWVLRNFTEHFSSMSGPQFM